MAKKITGYIKLQVPAGKANPAPPIGPALGQHGVNIMEFCKAYNAQTAHENGRIIPVEITVFEDRSFTFITKTPPAAVLIKEALGLESGSGERGIENKAGLNRQAPVRAAAVEGKQERQTLHEMRRDDVHQQSALVMGFAYEADVAKPQVAQATVDQLRGGGRRAGAEVGLVEERDGEAGTCRLGGDSGSDDPGSDHEQVELPPSELLGCGLASAQPHSGFVQAFWP